jgi:mannose-6-phosphate isomerase
MLHFIEVRPGDFFVIPAGAVHAIGSGVTLVEVQQASGITYRAWDWNRLGLDGKPRQLHINECRDVLNFSPEFQQQVLGQIQRDIFEKQRISLLEIADFKLSSYHLEQNQKISIQYNAKERAVEITVLSGQLSIDGETVSPFSSCLLLESGVVEIIAKEDTNFILVE